MMETKTLDAREQIASARVGSKVTMVFKPDAIDSVEMLVRLHNCGFITIQEKTHDEQRISDSQRSWNEDIVARTFRARIDSLQPRPEYFTFSVYIRRFLLRHLESIEVA